MTIGLALRRGLRVTNRAKRVWLIFYVVLTFAALVPAAAFTVLAFGSLGQSAWAEQLGHRFDLEWIGELAAAHHALPLTPILAAAAGIFAISTLAHLFLLGGAFEMFAKRRWFSASVFFGGCGRNFWRLLRLVIYSLVLVAAIYGIDSGLASLGDKIWAQGTAAGPLIYWSWFRAAVALFLLGVVNLIYDYTAIQLVADDSRQTLRGMRQSCRWLWAHAGRATAMAAVLWSIALLLLLAYFGISQLIPQQSLAAVLVLLLLRQALVVGRIWSRLLFYASQFEIYAAE